MLHPDTSRYMSDTDLYDPIDGLSCWLLDLIQVDTKNHIRLPMGVMALWVPDAGVGAYHVQEYAEIRIKKVKNFKSITPKVTDFQNNKHAASSDDFRTKRQEIAKIAFCNV